MQMFYVFSHWLTPLHISRAYVCACLRHQAWLKHNSSWISRPGVVKAPISFTKQTPQHPVVLRNTESVTNAPPSPQDSKIRFVRSRKPRVSSSLHKSNVEHSIILYRMKGYIFNFSDKCTCVLKFYYSGVHRSGHLKYKWSSERSSVALSASLSFSHPVSVALFFWWK